MVVTKIHPIKSTLKKALDYIGNPDETNGKLLVASSACPYEIAGIEFKMLLTQAYQEGNNLGHHLIQSFAPGETTPEQAHEVRKQLVEEVLRGRYPHMLTIHIDKGHIHSHTVFCVVDMVNQRKYISNRQSYAYIRRTSDKLCKENGLSVVKPGQSKGKSYAEQNVQRKGTSWRAKLKTAIDATIPQAKDLDDLLRLVQAQGYEIEPGKFISFRAPRWERFTRYKTLGEAYTEEAIKERIKNRAITRTSKECRGISLWTDLESNTKTQQSVGYERWTKLHNLKQVAKTLNFLTEYGINTYPDLESKVIETIAASDEAAATLKAMEHRFADMAVLIKNISIYKQLWPAAMKHHDAADRARFRREHESTLILYEAAAKALKEQGVKKLPDLYALKVEHKRLAGEKERLYEEYGETREQVQEYGVIKQNVGDILCMTPGKEWTQEL